MKIALFLILIALGTSCDLPNIEDVPYLSTKGSLACDVRNQAFVQLKREKDLYPIGSGAQMMDEIKMLGLYFNYYKEINIDEARDLLMSAAAVFLEIINKNEQIRPYLYNFPFGPKNIEIMISISNPDGSTLPSDKICFAAMINGKLEYEIKNPETLRLMAIYKETYNEAAVKLASVNALSIAN